MKPDEIIFIAIAVLVIVLTLITLAMVLAAPTYETVAALLT